MLLDEIDEMADMVKKTYSAMEQIYAMYLPFFPMESARIDMLHQLINSMNEDQASAPCATTQTLFLHGIAAAAGQRCHRHRPGRP